ncbi:hypothetical protein CSKR_113787, partial [Clonorchis sinensis]
MKIHIVILSDADGLKHPSSQNRTSLSSDRRIQSIGMEFLSAAGGRTVVLKLKAGIAQVLDLLELLEMSNDEKSRFTTRFRQPMVLSTKSSTGPLATRRPVIRDWIEEKFEQTKRVGTDRLCTPCPRDPIKVVNNTRSVYQCCNVDLCLGVSSDPAVGVTQAATTTITLVNTASSTTAAGTENPSMSSSKTQAQSMEPSAQTENQILESRLLKYWDRISPDRYYTMDNLLHMASKRLEFGVYNSNYIGSETLPEYLHRHPAVTPFRCPAAMLPEGSKRAGILPGCPNLDRGSQEAEVGFQPRAFRLIEIVKTLNGQNYTSFKKFVSSSYGIEFLAKYSCNDHVGIKVLVLHTVCRPWIEIVVSESGIFVGCESLLWEITSGTTSWYRSRKAQLLRSVNLSNTSSSSDTTARIKN